ncbi:MAG: alanine/glycine:cation symporter family protein [Methanocorpusculum sp.]|nr:alanine/glycine:cation symporter family protein [Methanocorpusculum sp.]
MVPDVTNPGEAFAFITSSGSEGIWSAALVLVICVSIYFTIRIRGLHLLKIKETLRLFGSNIKERSKSGSDSISAFRAFCTTMGNRVGIGNIAGVAMAIVMGGPGTIFWMWVFVLLLTAVSFVENTLGQIYKEKMKNGDIRGGPAYYVKNGLGKPKLAHLMSALLIILAFAYSGMQANQACACITDAFSLESPLIVGLIITAFAGIVFVGGVKRVVKISAKIVPIAILTYLLIVLIVIITNITAVGGVFESIFTYAFGIQEVAGGGVAAMFIWAMRRSVFSTDAGVGVIPNVSSLAEASHPVKIGLIQAFGTIIDVIVCTASAFVILIYTNRVFPGYNFSEVLSPAELEQIKGAPLVSDALSATFLGNAAPFVLSVLMVVFAFGTMIAHYANCETNVRQITQKPVVLKIFTVLLLIAVFVFTQLNMGAAWNITDIVQGVLCICNVVVILLLSRHVFTALRDYFGQKKNGVTEPEFIAETLTNTKGVTCWSGNVPDAGQEKQEK